jgi:hypothetical protein
MSFYNTTFTARQLTTKSICNQTHVFNALEQRVVGGLCPMCGTDMYNTHSTSIVMCDVCARHPDNRYFLEIVNYRMNSCDRPDTFLQACETYTLYTLYYDPPNIIAIPDNKIHYQNSQRGE